MIRPKLWLSLVSMLLASFQVMAADTDDIRSRFKAYWDAYASGDYEQASKLLHPEDLAGVKTSLLPIFITGLKTNDPELKQFAEMFFDGVPEPKRSSLSGAETTRQLMKVIALASPEAMTALKQSKMEIETISIDRQNPNSAVVKYKILLQGVSQSDLQQVSKTNGTWFVRTKERPEETTAKFKALFKM